MQNPASVAYRIPGVSRLPWEWRPNFRILVSGIPVAVFYALTKVAPPSVSVAGGFIAFTIVFYFTQRSRLYQLLTVVGFVAVAISAGVGIVASSEKAYLAAGPIANFVFVPLYLGSVLIGQPLVGGIAREIVPGMVGRLPVNAAVFMWLSVVWGIYEAAQGVVRFLLLSELSVGEYIVWSRVFGWPASAVMLSVTVFFIVRAARAHRDS